MSEMVRRVERAAEIFGEKTPQKVKDDLQELINAIDKYEAAPPIDIQNGEKPESKLRLVKLGNLANRVANAKFMLKVLCERYDIPWKQIELIEEKHFKNDETVRPLEDKKD